MLQTKQWQGFFTKESLYCLCGYLDLCSAVETHVPKSTHLYQKAFVSNGNQFGSIVWLHKKQNIKLVGEFIPTKT